MDTPSRFFTYSSALRTYIYGCASLLLIFSVIATVFVSVRTTPGGVYLQAAAVALTGAESTSTVSTPPPAPTLSILYPKPFAGENSIVVESTQSANISLAIRNTDTDAEKILPLKTVNDAHTRAVFTFMKGSVPPGTYRFIARATQETQTTEEQSATFTLEQVVTTTTSVSSSLDSSASVDATATTTTDTITPEPSFTFGALPETLTTDTDHSVSATNYTKNIKVTVENAARSIVWSKIVETAGAGTYSYRIPVSILSAGTYRVVIGFEYNGTTRKKVGPAFVVPQKPQATTTVVATTDDATSTKEAVNLSPVLRLRSATKEWRTYDLALNEASQVEFYVRSKSGLEYQGNAVQTVKNYWSYTINLTKLPPQAYEVVIKYKNATGNHDFSGERFAIEPILVAQEKIPNAAPIGGAATASLPVAKKVPIPGATSTTATSSKAKPEQPKQEIKDAFLQTTETPQLLRELSEAERDSLKKAIDGYAAALRLEEPDAIARAKAHLDSIAEAAKSSRSDEEREKIVASTGAYIQNQIERAKRADTIVRERTTNTIAVDTDNDGVSDFDELSLFNTDPRSADTDGDGRTDSDEILSGNNPAKTTETPEDLVIESPKETGITRDDILAVTAIRNVVEQTPQADGVPLQAEISGKGLPQSFVKIYIFSTPIVITLKTNDDGSFVYKFNKDLEEGTHEIYVGITDNNGAIVAKSAPFTFVKTAEAFSPADALAEVAAQPVTEASTFDASIVKVLLFALISALIGLLLLQVGARLDRAQVRKHPRL